MRIEHFVQKIWQNPDDFLRGVLTAIATRKEKRAVPRRRVVRDPIGSGQWNTCRPLERGAESTSPPFTFTSASGKKRRPISSPVSARAHPPTLPSPPRALIIIAIPLLISDTPGARRGGSIPLFVAQTTDVWNVSPLLLLLRRRHQNRSMHASHQKSHRARKVCAFRQRRSGRARLSNLTKTRYREEISF